MLRRIDRNVLFVAIALIVLFGLTLFVAPRSDRQASGSTFTRFPDGYGAWYATVEQEGGKIQRWQKPSEEFIKQGATGRTFLQINSGALGFGLTNDEEEWVKRGNTLVVLGMSKPATAASFVNVYPTGQGNVKIETSRRHRLQTNEQNLLSDRYGAIVWERTVGKGRIISSVTPFLAANVYQDEPGNFAFLTKLAKQQNNEIWVDEYLHGYKEKEVIKKETAPSWERYLLKTPLFPVLLQLIVLTGVLIWSKNRRFGQPMPLETETQDNNATYIQALAGVLRKANRSEFVVDAIAREEQIQIQRALGLGNRLVEVDLVVKAWIEQTGRSAQELEQVLPKGKRQYLSEKDLLVWLTQVQRVRQQLPQG